MSCVTPLGGAALTSVSTAGDMATPRSQTIPAVISSAHSSSEARTEKISALSLADSSSSVSVCQEFLLTDRLTGAAYLEKRLPSILSVALQESIRQTRLAPTTSVVNLDPVGSGIFFRIRNYLIRIRIQEEEKTIKTPEK